MLQVDVYKAIFEELVETFENEEISYDEFIQRLENSNQLAIESIGEEIFNSWLNIKPDYIELKKFNRNENQIALF